MSRTGSWSCPMAGFGVNDIKLLDSVTIVFSFSYNEQTMFQVHYSLHYVVTKHYVYIQVNHTVYDCMCYAGIWITGSREEQDLKISNKWQWEISILQLVLQASPMPQKKLLTSIFSEIIISVCPSRVTMYNSWLMEGSSVELRLGMGTVKLSH
jgi:hypothetical protein